MASDVHHKRSACYHNFKITFSLATYEHLADGKDTTIFISMNIGSVKRNFGSASAKDASAWIRVTGHIGIAAKAVVYLVVGFLAIKFAFDTGGQMTNTKGALSEIGSAPYGQILLSIVGGGLVLFAIYRLIGAWKDIDNRGSDGKGIFGRVMFAVSGLVYGALGASVFGLTFGGSSGGSSAGGSSGSKQSAVAELMSQPYGQWLVGVLGLGIIGYAGYQIYKAVKKKFFEKFRVSRMSDKVINTVSWVGAAGLSAHTVVMGIIGYFIIQAALTHDPSKTGGLKDALAWLAEQDYGPILLGVVSVGLFLYGAYTLFLARYRQFLQPMAVRHRQSASETRRAA